MAKKFMFICIGILALAGAYAVGAGNSVAQVGGIDVVHSYPSGNSDSIVTNIVTASGDIYARAGYVYAGGYGGTTPTWSKGMAEWTYMGNCFSGGAVNSQGTTIGDVKSLFR